MKYYISCNVTIANSSFLASSMMREARY